MARFNVSVNAKRKETISKENGLPCKMRKIFKVPP